MKVIFSARRAVFGLISRAGSVRKLQSAKQRLDGLRRLHDWAAAELKCHRCAGGGELLDVR